MFPQDIVPLSEYVGQVEAAVVDDFTFEGDDDDLFGADLDDGGDVLVGLVLGDADPITEQVDSAVGAVEISNARAGKATGGADEEDANGALVGARRVDF